jgi:hypothetical protein
MSGRCFIVHAQYGVFMGYTLGLAFFSKLGDAGQQVAAPVFDSFDAAREFVRSFSEEGLADGVTYFAVPKEYGKEGYVDSFGMVASGVPRDMLEQILANEAARAAQLRGPNGKLN